jgi:predicted DNA-binding transcriptional regulator YafY
MNRTDRLYALVEELRGRAPRLMRACELAEHFEISVRTVERDLAALQQAGVPIWTQPGPGGGYAVDPRTTLPPLNFSPAEATAVAAALAANRSMPFAEAGRSALRKLVAAMSNQQRDAASQLASRVRFFGSGVPDPDLREVTRAVEEALLAGTALDIDYQDREGEVTNRVIEPVGLLASRKGWYLTAWCRLRSAGRAFRLDRIIAARPTLERVPVRSFEEMQDCMSFAIQPLDLD